MSRSLANVNVRFGVDLKSFQTSMQKATKSLKNYGGQMQRTGRMMSMYLTAPIVGLQAVAVKAFDTQAKAEQKLSNAIRAAGRDAQNELQSFKAFASQLQSVTTVGDESTLELLSVATQMGLTADQAKVAAKEAIALAKAMGMNEQSAIRYTAALAQGDSTMLNRYIPTLKSIEDPAQRAAKAHELLANMFGAATAEAQAGLGPWVQLKNSFGDLMEEVGAIVSDMIQPLVGMLKTLVAYFQGLSEQTKKNVVVFASLAAAIGPVVATLGFFASTVLPAMIAGFAALASPVGIAIGIIAGLAAAFVYVYDNWEAIKERISDWGWWKNMLISMIQFFVQHNPFSHILKGYNYLAEKFGGTPIPDPFQMISDRLELLKAETKEYQHQFGSFIDAVKNGMNKVSGLFGSSTASAPEASASSSGTPAATGGSGGTGKQSSGGGHGGGVFPGFGALLSIGPAIEQAMPSLDEMTEKMGIFQGLANNLATTMGNMFANIGSSGVDAFAALGQVIVDFLKQLAAAVVKALILASIMAIMSGGGSAASGGFGAAFKGILGQSFGGFNASGGPVSPGTSYMVGEHGREMFVPNQGGRIIPHHQLAGMGGSMDVRVSGIARGKNMLLVQERAQFSRRRKTGMA